MRFVLAAYGSRGDVEPCAAAGRELLRRGHDVQMAVSPDKVGLVEAAGISVVPYGQDTREQMSEAEQFVRAVHNPIGALPELLGHLTRIWSEKTAVLTSLARGADLLVAGINEQDIAATAAEHCGVPLAALHSFPARVLSSGTLYRGMTKDVAAAQRHALGLREDADAPPAALEIQAYDALCLPGPADEWVEPDGRRPFVGALTLELPTATDDDVLAWIADGTPPICFGLGSTPVSSPADMVTMIGRACAQLGERALICTGPNDFADAPPFGHINIVGELNHAMILPACRALVHHGGPGTMAAGLRAAIPELALWQWLDQPVWAAGIERLKVGRARPFSATTEESLVADLRSVLAPECAARAREVSAQMTTAAHSAATAADLLEAAAAGA